MGRIVADITFVAASSSAVSAGLATPGVPAGTQDGDVLLCLCGSGYTMPSPAAAIDTPSGWTLGTTQELVLSSTLYYRASWFYKIASSESGSYSVGATGKDNVAAVIAYRNVSSTSPIHMASSVGYTTYDSIVRAAGVTTTEDGCMLVGLFVVGGAGPVYTPPSGMTERADNNVSSTAAIEVADVLQSTAGATGDKDAGINASAGTNKYGFLVALAPMVILTSPFLKSGNRIWG